MKDFLEYTPYFSLKDLEKINLNFKGLYSLRVVDTTVLPQLFKNELINNDTDVIYIGKGERTLLKRLAEDCRAKGHSTFFRGIGALLGFRPPKGSLVGKSNQNNYKFNERDKDEIIKWMNDNLEFNFIRLDNDCTKTEKALIKKYCPILNTTHNSKKSKILALVREECRSIAKSI